MNYRICLLLLLSLSLFSAFVLAEFTGTINVTVVNTTGIVTGLYGSTSSPYCNVDANCIPGHKCYPDWDGVSSGIYEGWCAPVASVCANHSSSVTSPEWHAQGDGFCIGNLKRECSIYGTWGIFDCTTLGKICVSGLCVSNGSVTTTTIGGDSIVVTTTTLPSGSLTVTSAISDFDIVQGVSVKKGVTVKNNGLINLSSVEIAISGIDSSWYSLSVKKFSLIAVNEAVVYIINISIPSDADVKTYDVTATITGSSSTSATNTFKLKVLPCEATIETEIKPLYLDCVSELEQLELNITMLEQSGINLSEAKQLLESAISKINQANSSMSSGDYFNANTLIEETVSMIGDIKVKMAEGIAISQETAGGDGIFIIVIISVLLIVGGILTYLFMPENFRPAFLSSPKFRLKTMSSAKPAYSSPKHRNMKERLSEIKNTISRMKKTEKKEKETKEKFKYEFKR